MKHLSIVSIGAGNVAYHLMKKLHKSGCNISQVYSRKLSNAKILAKDIDAAYTSSFNRIKKDADIYIVALPDDLIHPVLDLFKFKLNNRQIIIHTSGSKPSFSKKHAINNGVLYPLQTFNKDKSVDWKEIPCFTTGSNNCTLEVVEFLGKKLNKETVNISDEQRKHLHLSAVILNNFIHHLAYQSNEYLKKHDLKVDYLSALLNKTFEKIIDGDLKSSQTGPAKRNDKSVIKTQIALLKDTPDLKAIYKTLSQSIIKTYA